LVTNCRLLSFHLVWECIFKPNFDLSPQEYRSEIPRIITDWSLNTCAFTWTWPIGRGKIAIAWTLGVRLVVGQRTLTPYAEVRILDPQPDPPVRRLQNSLTHG
jgi:hypothetical protein